MKTRNVGAYRHYPKTESLAVHDRFDVAIDHKYDHAKPCRPDLGLAEDRAKEPDEAIQLWDKTREKTPQPVEAFKGSITDMVRRSHFLWRFKHALRGRKFKDQAEQVDQDVAEARAKKGHR